MRKFLRGFGVSAMASVAAALVLGGTPAGAGDLILYTASNPKIEKDVMAAFMKAHPEIKVSAINDSTGPITERIIAEKANPQADVVWMINDIALEQLKEAGALEPYEPDNSPVDDAFKDADGFYMGHNATIMGMAVSGSLEVTEEHVILKGDLPTDSSFMGALIEMTIRNQVESVLK